VIRHTGSCHCGRVRFEVLAPPKLQVSECNCSMCSKAGYLPPHRSRGSLQAHFRERGAGDLQLQHSHSEAPVLFSLWHQVLLRAALASDGFSVNARCLDPGTVQELSITQFNGREWEKQYPKGRGEYAR